MNRRGFLGAILAASAAPAIVRAGSLMRINPAIIVPSSPYASLLFSGLVGGAYGGAIGGSVGGYIETPIDALGSVNRGEWDSAYYQTYWFPRA